MLMHKPKPDYYCAPWVWSHVQCGTASDDMEYRQARFLGSTYCTRSGVPYTQPLPHRHFGHDLLIAASGSLTISIEDEDRYTLAPGSILVVPGGNGHRRIVHENACCCGIEISPDFFCEYLNLPLIGERAHGYTQRVLTLDHGDVYRLDGTPLPVTMINDHRAYRTFLNLFEECLTAYSLVTPMRSQIIYTFGSHFTQFLLNLLTQQLPLIHRQSTALRLREAKQWIDRHYAEEVSMIWLAERANLSPHWFTTAFKAVVGQTPKAYLLSLRLQHAAYLLTETELTVTDIAHRVGYNDHTNFIRAFTTRFSHPPQQYRLAQKLGHDR